MRFDRVPASLARLRNAFGLLLVAVFASACQVHTDDVVLGESGQVLFNAIGEFTDTRALSDPVCVGCTIFLEASDPYGGQDTLLTDVILDVNPRHAADVTSVGGGRAIVTPLVVGDFQIVAYRDGDVYDSIWVEGAEIDAIDLVDATRVTEGRNANGAFRASYEDVRLVDGLLLADNQELRFTMVPLDIYGRPLLGILEIGIFTDPFDALDVDVSLPAFPGVLANRVTLRPNGLAGLVDVFVEDLPTGAYTALLLDLTGDLAPFD